jgi:glycosyltransferase involved in cell wall biosynthesis
VKILVIVHQFLPKHAAGSEYYTYYLAKELQRRGHDVHLYFTEIDHDRPHADLRTGEYDGLPFHEAVNNHKFPGFQFTYKDSAAEKNLKRVLDEVRPEIVHVQHLHLHSIGYLQILASRGLKIVFTLHEYITMCHRNGQLLKEGLEICEGPEVTECAKCARHWPPPEGASDADGEDPYIDAVSTRIDEVKAGLAHVDLFISPSAFLRQKFIDYGFIDPDRIIHSDNGLDTSKYRVVPKVESDKLRIGYFGTISAWKGIHILVEAFNGIPEQGVECKIYGDISFLRDYVRSLREMRHHLDVRFMGEFENTRVAEVLASIDVLVVPSVWFENSPLTIHEAYLAGVPVICSDRGGMAELVEDGKSGLHFRMGDAADLRAKIMRLLDEPKLLDEIRSRIPAVKDIKRDAADMEKRYDALLTGEAVAH